MILHVNRAAHVAVEAGDLDYGLNSVRRELVTSERIDGVATLPPFQLPYADEVRVYERALEFFCDGREGYQHRPSSYVVHVHNDREKAATRVVLKDCYDLQESDGVITATLKAKYKPTPVVPGRYDNDMPATSAYAADKAELIMSLAGHIERLKRCFGLDEPELARVVAQLDGVVVP